MIPWTRTPVVFEQEYFPEDELIYEELPYTVEVEDGMYVVEGPKIEKMLGYTNLDSEKGFAFFQKFLKETGILNELEGKRHPGRRYSQDVRPAVLTTINDAVNTVITDIEGESNDNKTESLFKKPGNDNGTDLPGRQILHDAGSHRSGLRGARSPGTDQDQRAQELCR